MSANFRSLAWGGKGLVVVVNGRVWCFARGRPGDWEAICLDFDIAVQGNSFDDVLGRLESAVNSYVEDALAEPPDVARKLLTRRAPLSVRVRLVGSYLLHVVRSWRRRDGDCQAGFDLPCPA